MNSNTDVINRDQRARAIRRTVLRSLFSIASMVLFTLALIPLYDVFCNLTGLNGRSVSLTQESVFPVTSEAKGQLRQVQFITQVGSGLSVKFVPLQSSQTILPGGKSQVMFRFRNMSDQPVVAQAIPSVSPAQASQHVLKIECFCFQQLQFAAYESKDIPLIYFLSADMPDDVTRLTLAYNLYLADTREVSGG